MTPRAFRLLLPSLLLAFGAAPSARAADPPTGLKNPGFEDGAAGEKPPGWELTERSAAAGYTAVTGEERPAEGKRAAVLAPGTPPGQSLGPLARGSLRQSLDATPYRGKRIRLRASVRTEGAECSAQIWIGVDRPGAAGTLDGTSPEVAAGDWTVARVVADVPAEALKVNLGLRMSGAGRAFFDAVAIDVVGEAGAGNEPPRALAGRGLDNLVAFTRLLGLVRFFHPSDEAAAADWETLALAGVQRAEGAKDAAQLAQILTEIFRPVAPTLRVAAGGRPPFPGELAKPPGTATVTAWEHQGVRLSQAASFYDSERIAFTPGAPPPGALVRQRVEATAFHGKTVRLTAFVRGEGPRTKAGRLELAAIGLTPGRNESIPLAEANAAAKVDIDIDGSWKAVEVQVVVPAEAMRLEIGLGIAANAQVFWDDAVLTVDGAPLPAPAGALDNAGFEEEKDPEASAPAGWYLRRESRRAGYRTSPCPAPHAGSGCLALAFTAPSPQDLPRPDAPLVVDLGGGVTALVPLALYRDGRGTLPRVAPALPIPAPKKPDAFLPSGNDRATRLADIALAWPVFAHFYPYFDVVGADWNAELSRALTAAATDASEMAFLDTLRRLVAALHDGHGGVYFGREGLSHVLPLAWAWIEDQLVITRVAPAGTPGAEGLPAGLAAGDAVVAIDGRPAGEVVAAREALESAATPQWRRYRTVDDLLWGTEGEAMRLTVRHPDGRTAEVVARCTLPYAAKIADLRPDKIAEVRPGIFYVDIDRIDDDDFKAALDRLAAAKGVVFDLRGYPHRVSPIVLAHLTDRTLTTARYRVPIVTRPDRQGVTFDFSNWSVPPEKPRLAGKAAFLIDGRAISTAETYLGFVENYHLAALVGSPTAGTNGNINPFDLPGGYRVVWTGIQVLKQDGSRHHGVGILPTVPVQRTIQGVAAGKDEILEKGIEVVSSP